MECPVCKAYCEKKVDSCPECGVSLKLYVVCSELQAEMKTVQENVNRSSEKLFNIRGKFDQLSSQLQQDLAAQPRKKIFRPEPKTDTVQFPGPETGAAARPAVSPSEREDVGPFQEDAGMREIQVGQKWLLVAGIVLTLFGIAYFLKYSFDRNWISPILRVLMGYFWGVSFLGVGEYFRRKQMSRFGLYLIGGGIAVLYSSTFAAYQIYGILDQVTAFSLMIVTTMLAGTLALSYDTKWLAVLGIAGGFLTPLLLGSEQSSQTALMTYMAILNAGILGIASFKQWELLNAIGFACTWLLFGGWYANHYEPARFWPTIIFLNIFFLTYATVPFLYYLTKERRERLRGMALCLLNSCTALGFSAAIIEAKYRTPYISVATLSYVLVFMAMATVLYHKGYRLREPLIFLISKAMLFLIITIPLLFSGYWITVFWAAQVSTLFWASKKLNNKALLQGGLILLAIMLVRFMSVDIPDRFLFSMKNFAYQSYFGDIVQRLLTFAMVLLPLHLLTSMSAMAKDKSDQDFYKKGSYAIFAALLFLFLNMEVSGFCYEKFMGARAASLSVLWTIVSIVTMLLGFGKRVLLLRHSAIALFILTIIKVFFVDVADVSTPYRILSFLILGIVLIVASFLYYRYKNVILDNKEDTRETVS